MNEQKLLNSLPDVFAINFNKFDQDFRVKFVKIPRNVDSHPISSSNIYVIDEMTNQPVKYDLSNDHVIWFYKFEFEF